MIGSHDTVLCVCLQEMGLEVVYSETGRRLPASVPDECRIVFVCEAFSGPDFDRLVEKKFRSVVNYCSPLLRTSLTMGSCVCPL